MCRICNRRQLFLGLLFAGVVRPAFAQNIEPEYCSWNASELQNFKTYGSSGNGKIDRAIIAELKKILKIFPIDPGFKFIDDQSPNAFAIPDNVVAGTTGTVFIGLRLINNEFSQSEYGGVAVAGICAHECAHVYQMNTGYMSALSGPTAKLVELHADYLAGFYLGKDGSHPSAHIDLFAQSLYSRGDYNFNNRQHHGTPEQRLAAMQKGYGAGADNVDLSEAADDGSTFVKSL
jgi:hypothetical protein